MTLWLLRKTFGVFIGRVPKENRVKYWEAFENLVGTVVREGMKGTVEGAKK